MITSSTKTVAIWGAANRGKTSTIVKIYEKISKSKNFTLLYHQKLAGVDFICIAKFFDKFIAFNSAGDSEHEVKKGIDEINKIAKSNSIANIDCFICAVRTKGSSVNVLENLITNNLFYFDSSIFINEEFEKKIWFDKFSDFQSERIFDFVINHI